ncbi:hypothetical protein [Hyphococcus luteus]|uniref:Uncharacterized protein n=1 Tax=Hyphococcus luteus TaxID=2058213 RepID=A0A2S7K3V9_9PROT|nr:hypothetical protein [Marinicaulis flavus]PQA87182.1 hypothetical protein CW354_14175 [Marinicaulis flavus]
MGVITQFPDRKSLSRRLANLSPAARLRKRRRVESIARRWATRLTAKYGSSGALAVCRKKLLFCISHAPGVREQIWNRVYNYLSPPPERHDKWRRGPEG